ncbi:hypothetical protein EIP91_005110, partial [Steccherinum ochraceum]
MGGMEDEALVKLSEKASSITSVILTAGWHSTASQLASVSAIIRTAMRLQDVKVYSHSPRENDIWEAIVGSSATLRKIEFGTITPATLKSSILFPVLTELKLIVQDHQILTDIFKNTTFPHLTSLTCGSYSAHQAHPDHASIFINAIVSSCSHETLTSLSLLANYDDHESWPGEHRAPYISSEVLRPLLKFKWLHHLHIAPEWSWNLDDKLVEQMAHAWPGLTHLHLDPNPFWLMDNCLITFRSLETLARRCPDLEHFGAIINSTPPPPASPPGPPLNGHWHGGLLTLCVGDSGVDACGPVAAYLSGVFPNLQEIRTHNEQFPTEWQQIHALGDSGQFDLGHGR